MLETCGSAGDGVYLPGDRVEVSSKIGAATPVERYNPMLTVVPGDGSGHEAGKVGSPSLIDEIVREGARLMLAEALQAEVEAYIAAFAAERDGNGRRPVVRNGYHQPREVLTSTGAVEVTAPRVNDKRTDPQTGERRRFSSAILPAWARETPKVTEVLPLLYLHGLSRGDFVPALGQILGSSAGLSAAVITRLTVQAHRVSPRPLARRQRTASGRPRPRRGRLHQRAAHRTIRHPARRQAPRGAAA
jgi:hypothetical protein